MSGRCQGAAGEYLEKPAASSGALRLAYFSGTKLLVEYLTNPDFGDTFPQIVDLVNVPAIPNTDLAIGSDAIQLIANTAGFHFATIEQGGSSLYDSFLPKATSLEVINGQRRSRGRRNGIDPLRAFQRTKQCVFQGFVYVGL